MAKTNKTAAGQQPVPAGYVPSLKKAYKEQIVDALMKQFNYTTVMQVPKLIKITINEGIGEATNDKKLVEDTFKVATDANKTQVKLAVEEIFGVEVAKVNIMNYDGKVKRMGRNVGRTAAYKKAVVTLTEKSKEIEFFQGL